MVIPCQFSVANSILQLLDCQYQQGGDEECANDEKYGHGNEALGRLLVVDEDALYVSASALVSTALEEMI